MKFQTKSQVKQWEMVSTKDRTYLKTWRIASRLSKWFSCGTIDILGDRKMVMDAKGKAILDYEKVPLGDTLLGE